MKQFQIRTRCNLEEVFIQSYFRRIFDQPNFSTDCHSYHHLYLNEKGPQLISRSTLYKYHVTLSTLFGSIQA